MSSTPRGHRLRTVRALAGNRALVRMLAAYTFNIDYSHLPAVPAAAVEGYVYVPGSPVAIWQ